MIAPGSAEMTTDFALEYVPATGEKVGVVAASAGGIVNVAKAMTPKESCT